MEGEKYIVGLGYGGNLESMAQFEWDFRCLLGLREQQDAVGKQAFIQEFIASTSPSQPIVLVLDDYNTVLFRSFMEMGKQAINKYEGLYVFAVVEDQNEYPSVQYFLNIENDPFAEELFPHQMVVDAEGVPDEVFVFLQSRLDVQFYRRDEDIMMEFKIEELPIL